MRNTVMISCLLVAGSAIAEPGPMKGEAELGFVSTSGNSETQTLNAKVTLTKETEAWKHKAIFTALNNASEDQDSGQDETTAEQYTASLKSDKTLDERSYLYGLGTYDKNRFSGYDYQATVGLGYGYKIIMEEDRTLNLEVGPGYRVSAIEGGEDEDEVTLRLGETYDWTISEGAKLHQYLVIEGGDENTITTLGGYVQSAISGALALKLGIDIKHQDEVPAGNDDTDTKTYATLVYGF